VNRRLVGLKSRCWFPAASCLADVGFDGGAKVVAWTREIPQPHSSLSLAWAGRLRR